MVNQTSQMDNHRDIFWYSDQKLTGHLLNEFIEAISNEITGLDIHAREPDDYSAQWLRLGIGKVDFNVFTASPQRVVHSFEKINSRHVPSYELLYLRRGGMELRHSNFAVNAPEGSFLLVDNDVPWELTFPEGCVCYATHLQDDWFRSWVPHPKPLAATPLAAEGNWGAPLASLLCTIHQRRLDDVGLPRHVIADQIGAFIALLAGSDSENTGLHQESLFARAKVVLQDRFQEHDLSPQDIAKDMGISKRHLHGIFARSGTTFGRSLLETRLSRAKDLLADKRYASYRISDIAWVCGFSDPGHFTRRFRERFGIPPSQSRSLD